MNKNNLILTSTSGMSREEWLEFRKPMNHVRKKIVEWLHKRLGLDDEIQAEDFFRSGKECFPLLKEFFASDEWKEFLFPCVGGSDLSTVMGLNPYKSIIELYFEKTGMKEVFDQDNAAMFWGRELEEQVCEKWQYWDGNVEGMIANFTAGNIIRRCRRLNAYVQNKNFPWLYVSLDRVINKTKDAKETITGEGSLEGKTISGYAADMWESGIPPMYVVQLQGQITVCEFSYGEMAILKDGRHYDVIPFDLHPGISEGVVRHSENFFKMVKAGIEQYILHLYCSDEEQKAVYYSEAERLAPEPDGSVAYENYLSQRYKDKDLGGITGNVIQLELARQYVYVNGRMKLLDEIKREASNKLKAAIGDFNKLDFGDDGTVTWKQDSRGVRSMRVNVKLPEGYVPDAFKPDPGATVEEKVLAHNKEERVEEKKEVEFKGKGRKKTIAEDSNRGE